MKLISIILYLIFCVSYMNAQEPNNNSGHNIRINSGGSSLLPPLVYFNGLLYSDKDLIDLNPDTIGVVFAEGDSSYVSRTYGNSPDTSLIHQYFGEQRNRGVLFIFTKDKVQTVSKKKLLQCIKDERCKVVFKVNNAPLTNYSIELDPNQIDKIQMVKDFKLTKWDTGDEDVFTLFVIKTKI